MKQISVLDGIDFMNKERKEITDRICIKYKNMLLDKNKGKEIKKILKTMVNQRSVLDTIDFMNNERKEIVQRVQKKHLESIKTKKENASKKRI
jgi:hypothetical protein